ncbi:MAG: hypothetical protein EA351_11355 [Gemmatimonadales bacterium]|nr:MAG: hypothetical protein EA351_11355 [Gemmatimonadales bacterium]
MVGRIAPPVLVAAVFFLVFANAPADGLSPDSCGEKGDLICSETETCERFLFFFKRNCTVEYEFWDFGVH